MSYTRRFIIALLLLFTTAAHAVEVFLDGLYWRATETIDWSWTDNLNSSNQVVSYNTVAFDFKPGFRIGVANEGDWDTKFYYTYYYTNATSAITGNVVSAFFGGRMVESSNGNFFFKSGQALVGINYNMFDLDFGKRFYPSAALMLRPIIGLKGGWINQRIDSSFQGLISVNESITNNFQGIGPKAAIETKWLLPKIKNGCLLSIFADFTASYLWGDWKLSDVVHDSLNATIYTNVGHRNLGAFALQGIAGVALDYKCFAMKFGYEIADWFNQYQVFDDATGAHNNDLVLQGLTLRLVWIF